MRLRPRTAWPLLHSNQPATGDLLERRHVAISCLHDDVVGKHRRGTVLVPRGPVQKLAHELLVEGRLGPAGNPIIRRPKPRTIRRQDFIDQNQTPLEPAPLSLGISDEDPFRLSDLAAATVDLDGTFLQLVRDSRTKLFSHHFEGNILIVPCFRFGGRSK